MADKIKLLFMDGTWVDFEKPQGFDLATFVHGCRSLGFVMGKGFYVPFGLVKLVMDMSTAEHIYGTSGAPQATAPGTETKQ